MPRFLLSDPIFPDVTLNILAISESVCNYSAGRDSFTL